MLKNVSYTLEDKHTDLSGGPNRWTFGNAGGIRSAFGGAYPDGSVNVQWWDGTAYKSKIIKCRSYRRAVRVLRWHLMGYKV